MGTCVYRDAAESTSSLPTTLHFIRHVTGLYQQHALLPRAPSGRASFSLARLYPCSPSFCPLSYFRPSDSWGTWSVCLYVCMCVCARAHVHRCARRRSLHKQPYSDQQQGRDIRGRRAHSARARAARAAKYAQFSAASNAPGFGPIGARGAAPHRAAGGCRTSPVQKDWKWTSPWKSCIERTRVASAAPWHSCRTTCHCCCRSRPMRPPSLASGVGVGKSSCRRHPNLLTEPGNLWAPHNTERLTPLWPEGLTDSTVVRNCVEARVCGDPGQEIGSPCQKWPFPHEPL